VIALAAEIFRGVLRDHLLNTLVNTLLVNTLLVSLLSLAARTHLSFLPSWHPSFPRLAFLRA
jgi:hypothetical protein